MKQINQQTIIYLLAFAVIIPCFSLITLQQIDKHYEEKIELEKYHWFDDSPYNDTSLMEGLNKDLLEGVEIRYSNVSYLLEDDEMFVMGMYRKNKIVLPVLDMPLEFLKEVLCHEIAHHIWHTKLSDHEREYWEYLFQNAIEDGSYIEEIGGAGEYHSEMWEKDYEKRCY